MNSAYDDLARMFTRIVKVAESTLGVEELEPSLVDLLAYLQSDASDQSGAEELMQTLASEWPEGAVEALEFTMRSLKWEGVRSVLLAQRDGAEDFRHKDQARRVLEAYEPDWPGGEIYSTYRTQT